MYANRLSGRPFRCGALSRSTSPSAEALEVPDDRSTILPIFREGIQMTVTFGATSTTDYVLASKDLSGRRVLVSGVSAGLGVETARALVARGASVVGTARNLAKGQSACSHVDGRGSLEVIEMDLASFASVRACADRLLERDEGFDAVIANAGVMVCPQGRTEDGFETQFGTNHLGHFVFVNRLAPLLAAGSRVVCLASLGHRISDIDLDDPNFEHRPYSPSLAYGQSKTANILFAIEFDRRHRQRGVRAAAVHPGGIQTELGRHVTPDVMEDFRAEVLRVDPSFDFSVPLATKTVPQGAATTVWAGFVAAAEEVGGRYCEDCHVAEVNDGPGFVSGVRSYALDADRAKALWALSEELVGERFRRPPGKRDWIDRCC
jgi:NAD(P)-dependent dehydrogenase (short-subunit alcohol dehydrogenase family)